MTQPDAVTRVAQDLTATETMVAALPGQAVRRAADPDMPGGDATVALGPVALPSEWAEGIAWHELHHLSTCPRPTHRDCRYAEHAADARDDDDPLGVLLFWTEQWREARGYPLAGRRPTWATEASFLRHSLTWAWETEPHFADLARDVATVRARLESLLHDGIRSERGAPCMYDECRGIPLVRKLVPTRDERGGKTWRQTPWHCPRCHREWDEDAYARMVTAASEAAKAEVVAGETWCSVDYAARKVSRPQATIRSWVQRGHVATACIIEGRRRGFVRLADVEDRQRQLVEQRRRAARQRYRRRRLTAA